MIALFSSAAAFAQSEGDVVTELDEVVVKGKTHGRRGISTFSSLPRVTAIWPQMLLH